jgi:hypothetical protein
VVTTISIEIFNKSVLKINSKTWKKYTEDLFDFEADDMIENELKVNQTDFNHFIYTESNLYC